MQNQHQTIQTQAKSTFKIGLVLDSFELRPGILLGRTKRWNRYFKWMSNIPKMGVKSTVEGGDQNSDEIKFGFKKIMKKRIWR